MRLWLDDQIGDHDTPERHTPVGYTGVSTALQACRFLRNNVVTHIDFDHDLGVGPTGYTVARFIEKQAFLGVQGPMTYRIHSANPVGRDNIHRAMESAQRFWKLDVQRSAPYERYELQIFPVCEALHGALKCSCDPLPDAEKQRLIAFLRLRFENWEPTLAGSGLYDSAVRLLVGATLAEAEGKA